MIDLGIYHYYRRPNSITLSNFNSTCDFYDSISFKVRVQRRTILPIQNLMMLSSPVYFIGSLHIFILISDSSKEELFVFKEGFVHLRRILKIVDEFENKAIYLMLSLTQVCIINLKLKASMK